MAPDVSGQWLLTGSADGTVKLWETVTGRCSRTWDLGESVVCVAWCPDPALRLVSAVSGKRVVLLASTVASEEVQMALQCGILHVLEASVLGGRAKHHIQYEARNLQVESAADRALDACVRAASSSAGALATWSRRDDGGVEIAHKFIVKHVTWHAKGDYFASTAPTGNTQVRTDPPHIP